MAGIFTAGIAADGIAGTPIRGQGWIRIGVRADQHQTRASAIGRRPGDFVIVNKILHGVVERIVQFDSLAAIAQRGGIGKHSCHRLASTMNCGEGREVTHDQGPLARCQAGDRAARKGKVKPSGEMHARHLQGHAGAEIGYFHKLGLAIASRIIHDFSDRQPLLVRGGRASIGDGGTLHSLVIQQVERFPEVGEMSFETTCDVEALSAFGRNGAGFKGVPAGSDENFVPIRPRCRGAIDDAARLKGKGHAAGDLPAREVKGNGVWIGQGDVFVVLIPARRRVLDGAEVERNQGIEIVSRRYAGIRVDGIDALHHVGVHLPLDLKGHGVFGKWGDRPIGVLPLGGRVF